MESRESIDLDFSRYLLSVKRRWLPAVGVFMITTVGIAAVATVFLKPSYEAKGKLLFKLDRTSYLTGVGEQTKDLSSLVASQNPVSTEIEVVYSIPLLQKTIDELDLKNEERKKLKPEEFKKKLSAKIVGGTDVLQLSYKSRDPKEAAAVVNKVMSLYIKDNILTNQAEAADALAFISKQLPYTEATVRQAEAELRKFKEKNNVVALSEEATEAVKVIANLDNQITATQAELQKANARATELSNKVGLNSQEAMALSSLSQSPAVQGILTELQGVEKQLAAEGSRFQEQNPRIVSLRAKQAALQTLLQDQIKQVLGSQRQVPEGLLQIGDLRQNFIKELVESEVQRRSLERGIASFYNSRSAYQQRVNILPQLEQNQRELERKLKAAQSTYETLLTKFQEAQLAQNKNTSNARIIEQAIVPEKPASSLKIKAMILSLGAMLGILLATSTILLLEMRDRSIKTLKEVKDLFGYPLLGIIPSFGKKNLYSHRDPEWKTPEIPVRDAPHSLVSEIYRMIQANLKFLSSDKELKIIVVTSSVPKEGKSTISANLAAAMAQLGRRVLLVDADMRRPCQHHVWELTNAAGLSDVLVGQAEFGAAAFEVMDNLDVLASGVMPPNPLALLDSKRMASLIKDFSDKYDFVIIDAPPLILAADALTLSQMSDGILLVARPGVVDYASVNAAKEILERSGQNVLGLVVNGVAPENKFSSYFYNAKEELAPANSITRGTGISQIQRDDRRY